MVGESDAGTARDGIGIVLRLARAIVKQHEEMPEATIATFIKQGTRTFEYEGEYHAIRLNEDPEVVASARAISSRTDRIEAVLYMEERWPGRRWPFCLPLRFRGYVITLGRRPRDY